MAPLLAASFQGGLSLPLWLGSGKKVKLRLHGRVLTVYADRDAFLLETTDNHDVYWVGVSSDTRWKEKLETLQPGRLLIVDGVLTGHLRVAAVRIR